MVRQYKTSKRECSECGVVYDGKGNQKTCSEECKQSRHKEQLDKQSKERRERSRVEKSNRKDHCTICKRLYNPTHWRQRYCCEKCRNAGLQVAIERQRIRREEMKANKEEG